jgi:hypothetical protein
MTPDEWNKVKGLFDATLARELSQRAAFLQQNCLEAKLRQEVEKLLINHREADSFLSHPILNSDAALDLATRLGSYEILGLMGAAGISKVYRARDTRLDRTIAIRLVKNIHNERFEWEALPALNHPHLCALYDIGAITQVCSACHEIVSTSEASAEVPEILGVETRISELQKDDCLTGLVATPAKQTTP